MRTVVVTRPPASLIGELEQSLSRDKIMSNPLRVFRALPAVADDNVDSRG